MNTIRLIREVNSPSGRGPGNGMFALQRALRARCPEWLHIGGTLQSDELPWFWSYADRRAIARCARAGRPFVVGPNVVFQNSRRPRIDATEAAILDAPTCRMMFAHSRWYGDLLKQHRGPANRAPVVLWPYPIDPKPFEPNSTGPFPAEYDLLIYAKSGPTSIIEELRRRYHRMKIVRYGRYRRSALFAAAAVSRCCLYLSDDDHGPLALAEILLSGCPAVGVPRGAPFVRHGRTGMLLEHFDREAVIKAIERCHRLDRQTVAELAAEQFDTDRIVTTVINALGKIGAQAGCHRPLEK